MKILSLGAGVQSSAMLLMSDRGIIDRADYAIFSDTQSEPSYVYEWLEKLKSKSSIPIVIVTAGNLGEESLTRKFNPLPTFTTYREYENLDENYGADVLKKGMGRRQCTAEYKIRPITKEIRKLLGMKRFQRVKTQVFLMMGISKDEIFRVKTNREKWIKNDYPLIKLDWDRKKCSDYVLSIMGVTPQRSACYFCPFMNDHDWMFLKNNHVEYFLKAIEFDDKIRDIKPGMKQFLHSSRTPLKEVVFKEDNQIDLFNNECEGMCGV